jgi:histidine phosphotransfer protein HptB
MIDWSRVRELREEVGADDFAEIVDLFIEEVEEVVNRLATTPVLSELEQDMHFLKGGALNLGFLAFSRLCQDGELKSAAGEPESVDVAAVVEGFTASRRVFLDQMDTRMAG